MPAVNERPGLVIYKDTVYDLRANGAFHKYLGSGKGWKAVGGSAHVTQLAIGNNIYQLDTTNNVTYAAVNIESANLWKSIDRSPERKNIAASTKFIYKIHLDQGRIYQYSSKDWNLVDDGVRATAIVVDDDDTLYQLHEGGGAISQYLGSEGWQEIDSTPNVKRILVGGGKLYKVHNDNGIYVHREDYDWDRLDKNADTIDVAAGPAGLIQQRRDGSVLKYDETDKKWVQILGANSLYVGIAAGDSFYMRRKDNNAILRYNPTAGNWPVLN